MNHNDQEFLVQKIRTQYTEKEFTDLDTLRALDSKVKKPANVFAYTFGIAGALIMGAGMSLIMTDIGATIGITEPLVPGLAAGLAGMAMAIANYPAYWHILSSRRKKYAPQIIELSNKISGRADV